MQYTASTSQSRTTIHYVLHDRPENCRLDTHSFYNTTASIMITRTMARMSNRMHALLLALF